MRKKWPKRMSLREEMVIKLCMLQHPCRISKQKPWSRDFQGVLLLLLRGLEPTVIQKHFAIVLLSCVVMNVFTCRMWTIVAHRAC